MKASILVIVFATVIVSCQTTYPTIPYAKTAEMNIRLPFVKKYESKGKALWVYGGYHTNDTADVEIRDIESHLDQFQPHIILYEGDYIGVEATRKRKRRQLF